MKSNIKLLIYDLLNLIDDAKHESCEEIEQRLSNGKLITYLLDKYDMPYFSKTDTQDVSDILKSRVGCTNKHYENGLIFIVDVLLDCE